MRAVALLTAAALSGSTAAEPLRVIKTVPEGATVEYRVRGVVVQSMALAPGTYEITVRDVAMDGVVHGRPRGRHP